MNIEKYKEILDLIESLPERYKILFNLSLYTLTVFIYIVFVWKFSKFITKREIIELNMSKYNNSQHPFLEKILALFFYTLEYVIILPFLVLFWFVVFSFFIMLISESLDMMQILILSTIIIASIRLCVYLGSDISRDLSRIFPLTILAIFVANPKRILEADSVFTRISQIPSIVNNLLWFLVFLFSIEFLLRLFYSISKLISDFKNPDVGGVVEVKKSKFKKLESYKGI